MKVLDLFAGLKGWSDPWEQRGHEVFSVDNDERFDVSSHESVLDLTPEKLPWRPDVILASPPCNCFSVMTIGRNWSPGYTPKRPETVLAIELVKKTVALIDELQPQFFVVENPRAVLRKLGILDAYDRRTVTYCQYGSLYMKPTDLWGGFPPSLILADMCRNGDNCHTSAARGSRTGMQGNGMLPFTRGEGGTSRWVGDVDSSVVKVRTKFRGGMIEDMSKLMSWSDARKALSAERAKIPEKLSLAICEAAERDYQEVK